MDANNTPPSISKPSIFLPKPTWLPGPVRFSPIWPWSSLPLCRNRSLLGPWVCEESGAREGGECQYKHRSAGFFASQESGEVNKQVLVFNCGPLIALPSSVLECSAPPFYCASTHRSDNLSFNFSLSASALLLSCLVQQLIRRPHHPFFLTIFG